MRAQLYKYARSHWIVWLKFMVCELCLNEAIMLKNKIRWPAHSPQFADIWNNCISSPILQLSKLIPEEEENQHLPKCNYVLNSGRFLVWINTHNIRLFETKAIQWKIHIKQVVKCPGHSQYSNCNDNNMFIEYLTKKEKESNHLPNSGSVDHYAIYT